jgi:hypothetical protein
VGAGYIERNWPPPLRETGAWPLAGLRQSFLNGSLTRLVDPDAVLKNKIVEFVSKGEFGLASGPKSDGGYERVWFKDPVASDEVAFEAGVFLLRKTSAEALKSGLAVPPPPPQPPEGAREPTIIPRPEDETRPEARPHAETTVLRLVGDVPPEVWNRLGTKVLPKLRSGSELRIALEFSVVVKSESAASLASELKQILAELGLAESVRVE